MKVDKIPLEQVDEELYQINRLVSISLIRIKDPSEYMRYRKVNQKIAEAIKLCREK